MTYDAQKIPRSDVHRSWRKWQHHADFIQDVWLLMVMPEELGLRGHEYEAQRPAVAKTYHAQKEPDRRILGVFWFDIHPVSWFYVGMFLVVENIV